MRTVFGNPANDAASGWERGTFFMYDPELVGGGPPVEEPTDWARIVLFSLAALVALCALVCPYCIWHRCCRNKGGKTTKTAEADDPSPRDDDPPQAQRNEEAGPDDVEMTTNNPLGHHDPSDEGCEEQPDEGGGGGAAAAANE